MGIQVFFWMQIVIFGMDGQLFNYINNFFLKEQGNVCDWVSLLYNRTWQNIVNQLCFNFFFKKKNYLLEFLSWLSGNEPNQDP